MANIQYFIQCLNPFLLSFQVDLKDVYHENSLPGGYFQHCPLESLNFLLVEHGRSNSYRNVVKTRIRYARLPHKLFVATRTFEKSCVITLPDGVVLSISLAEDVAPPGGIRKN